MHDLDALQTRILGDAGRVVVSYQQALDPLKTGQRGICNWLSYGEIRRFFHFNRDYQEAMEYSDRGIEPTDDGWRSTFSARIARECASFKTEQELDGLRILQTAHVHRPLPASPALAADCVGNALQDILDTPSTRGGLWAMMLALHGAPGHAMALKGTDDGSITLFDANLGYVSFPGVSHIKSGLGRIFASLYVIKDSDPKRLDKDSYSLLEIQQVSLPVAETEH